MWDETRRQAIRERVEKATEGPWEVHLPLHGQRNAAHEINSVSARACVCDVILGTKADTNAEFIAQARDDVPWLISQLSAAQEEIAHLRTQVQIASDMRALSDSEDRVLRDFDAAIRDAHDQYLDDVTALHADNKRLEEESATLQTERDELRSCLNTANRFLKLFTERAEKAEAEIARLRGIEKAAQAVMATWDDPDDVISAVTAHEMFELLRAALASEPAKAKECD